MAPPLPPLNALKAFETAARTGSYVAAARELGVSPAAVSQQVRHLETFLGKQLFTRFNNRVTLTDAGQAIFTVATTALQSIADLTRQTLPTRQRQHLVISVLPSVAERWLVPRLAALAAAEPALRFELRVEEDPVDFTRHAIDLRICYGTSLYPDHRTLDLRRDGVVPIASPAYAERHRAALQNGLAAVPDDQLIHTEWGPSFGSHPTWQAWYAASGSPRQVAAAGFRVGMSSLALDLAAADVGVALGQIMLAERDIASGRLVVLDELRLPLGHAYSLVTPHGKTRKAGLARVVEALSAS